MNVEGKQKPLSTHAAAAASVYLLIELLWWQLNQLHSPRSSI